MGKTCEPKAFSFQCMTEFTTNKKKNNKLKKKRKSIKIFPKIHFYLSLLSSYNLKIVPPGIIDYILLFLEHYTFPHPTG